MATPRAGVEVAFAHHDAALNHQGAGGKTKLIRAQQRADDNVTRRFSSARQPARGCACATVQHQGLLRLGQANLPGLPAFDGRPGDAPVPPSCPAITTWSALHGHARGDGAHAHF